MGYETTWNESRQEWTARKHRVIGTYIHVAIAKLSRFGRPIYLIDGYAGANAYGTERTGSTLIMAEEAAKSSACPVTVLACESDPNTFRQLQLNLADHIQVGRVRCFPGTHGANVHELLKVTAGASVIAFLDPEKPSSFGIDDDLRPWCERPGTTDILGLIFPAALARIVGANQPTSLDIVRRNIAEDESLPQTELEALRAFETAASPLKKFFGMYPMRKVTPKRIVYGIYGLSDHEAGFTLLSDTVARDFNTWKQRVDSGNLFEDDPAVSEKATLRSELMAIAFELMSKNPDLNVKQLHAACLKTAPDRSKFFGRFTESDFTSIRKEVSRRLNT